MNKITLIIMSFCMVLLINAFIPEKEQPASDNVKVVIADRTFKIPKGYFDGRSPSGKDTESVVLEYSLPDFEVLPPHPIERDARRELINKGLKKGMLVEAARNRPSFDEVVPNLFKGHNYPEQFELSYGLEKYVASSRVSGKPAEQPDTILIERADNGSIQSHLYCKPPGKVKIPGCRHRFIDKGLLYQITWHIRELPNWKQQRQKAINFIDSMEVKKKD